MNNVLYKKMMGFFAIGIGCFIVGISYGIFANDKVFILLSFAIVGMCVAKALNLYFIDKNKKYDVISGKCIEQTYNLMGRYRVIKINTGENIIEISVPKNVKLKLNAIYDLYFKREVRDIENLNNLIREKLLSDNFIGYEVKQNNI